MTNVVIIRNHHNQSECFSAKEVPNCVVKGNELSLFQVLHQCFMHGSTLPHPPTEAPTVYSILSLSMSGFASSFL